MTFTICFRYILYYDMFYTYSPSSLVFGDIFQNCFSKTLNLPYTLKSITIYGPETAPNFLVFRVLILHLAVLMCIIFLGQRLGFYVIVFLYYLCLICGAPIGKQQWEPCT